MLQAGPKKLEPACSLTSLTSPWPVRRNGSMCVAGASLPPLVITSAIEGQRATPTLKAPWLLLGKRHINHCKNVTSSYEACRLPIYGESTWWQVRPNHGGVGYVWLKPPTFRSTSAATTTAAKNTELHSRPLQDALVLQSTSTRYDGLPRTTRRHAVPGAADARRHAGPAPVRLPLGTLLYP